MQSDFPRSSTAASDIAVRDAVTDDGPILQDIERAAGEQFRTVGLEAVADDDPFTIDELDAYVAEGRSWVAVDGTEHVVGYVVVDEVDGCAHIEQVSVLPDEQGRGIGRALIDRVEAWAGAVGRPALTLTTFTDVPWNRPLYEHLGFRVLADAEVGPELRKVREHEATLGLDPRLRVCMCREVSRGSSLSDRDLFDRGMATVVASWVLVALGSPGAAVVRLDGVVAAVFPAEPERAVYNNAVVTRDLDEGARADALDAMEQLYRMAGVEHYAVWVHESDHSTHAEVERRGYRVVETTRAMGMSLADWTPRPFDEARTGRVSWPEYVQHLHSTGLSEGLLAGTDPFAFHVLGARRRGSLVATAIAFDHDDDCGLFNVSTLEASRRQGLGTALTTLLVHAAKIRGCATASLQSSSMAEHLYAGVGFRDLGRIVEFMR